MDYPIYLDFYSHGYFFISATKKKNSHERTRAIDFMTYIILGVLIGGRLGYMLFYDLNDFIANPLLFFRIDQGGMSSHGGIMGYYLLIFFCKKKQLQPMVSWRLHRSDWPTRHHARSFSQLYQWRTLG